MNKVPRRDRSSLPPLNAPKKNGGPEGPPFLFVLFRVRRFRRRALYRHPRGGGGDGGGGARAHELAPRPRFPRRRERLRGEGRRARSARRPGRPRLRGG